jgi:hypothetical protein
VKWRDGGSAFHAMIAAETPINPIAPSAYRQESRSAISAVSSRPIIPPRPFPPIANPIAKPIDVGWISSLRYAIDTAGSPAKVTPASVRSRSNAPHRGAKADMSMRTDDASNDPTIICVRPRDSENVPATSIAGARIPVVNESGKLLSAALTPNSRANTGMSGCTQ